MRGAFGEVLHRLIKRRYGTQKRFAVRAGLTESWVSQLVTGAATNVGYSALENLSGLFDLAEQEELHRAWICDFAPSPLQRFTPTAHSHDEEIIAYCRSVPSLIDAGLILDFFRTVRRLWRELRGQESRFWSAAACAVAYGETCNILGRRTEGIRIFEEMRVWAEQRQEPAIVAHCFWLMFTASRGLLDPRSPAAQKRQEDLSAYLEAWQPKTKGEFWQRQDMSHGVQRDVVLYTLELAKVDAEAGPLLEREMATLVSYYDAVRVDSAVTMCKEIEARALIAAGDLEGAHEALVFAKRGPQPDHPAHPVKTDITLAGLFIADRQYDQAERVLFRAKEASERHGLLHYSVSAGNLLGRLSRL